MTQEALKRITRDDTEHGKEYYLASDVDALLSEVRADEREACAKVCEQGLPIASSLSALDDMEMWGEKFAAAIRARGEQA